MEYNSIKMGPSDLPEEVQKILDSFVKFGYQIYIVGGAVRDLVMNRLVKDWDFTTDAKPEEILKIFPEGFYDNKFGTVGIPQVIRKPNYKYKGREIYEITTMRREGVYKDSRHPINVSWTNKIEDDLARRDFTINAMAFCINGKKELTLVDPFNGQKDLSSKLVKAVGDPNKRFKEDALRLVRAIRIATELEFDIEKNTLEAVRINAPLISKVSYERIRDELLKILTSANPYAGIIKLRDVGILQIILPELEQCFGIVQEGPKHDRVYEIGDHSLRTLREVPSSDPIVRLAALLHDIGKAQTYNKDSEGNVTFYNHDVVGGQIVLKIAKRFNLSKKQTDKLHLLVRWHLFTVDEFQTDSAIRRFIKNVGKENVKDMLDLRIGDRLGGDTRKPVSWRMEKFQKRIQQVLKKPFTVQDLKVDGHDVMNVLGISPGPKVGKILDRLFQEILDDSSKNNKTYLLARIKQLA